MAKQIPQRPEGWKLACAAGDIKVWHAGKNDYRITRGFLGEVIALRQHLGEAFSYACREHELSK